VGGSGWDEGEFGNVHSVRCAKNKTPAPGIKKSRRDLGVGRVQEKKMCEEKDSLTRKHAPRKKTHHKKKTPPPQQICLGKKKGGQEQLLKKKKGG